MAFDRDETTATLEHAMQNGHVLFEVGWNAGRRVYMAHCRNVGQANWATGEGATMLDAMLAAYRNLYPEGT